MHNLFTKKVLSCTCVSQLVVYSHPNSSGGKYAKLVIPTGPSHVKPKTSWTTREKYLENTGLDA